MSIGEVGGASVEVSSKGVRANADEKAARMKRRVVMQECMIAIKEE